MRWLVFSLVVFCCSCTDPARQVQVHAADGVAQSANAALPLLVSHYRLEGITAIEAAQTREEALASVAKVKETWKPVWDAWEALRTAQDAWATGLETDGDLGALLPKLQAAWCALLAVWPTELPTPLAPLQCPA